MFISTELNSSPALATVVTVFNDAVLPVGIESVSDVTGNFLSYWVAFISPSRHESQGDALQCQDGGMPGLLG